MLKPGALVSRDSARLAAFSVLFGLLSALFIGGYTYGAGGSDHIEQLPIVLRIIDPEYLSNDPFVVDASGFGPRFYYAHIIAFGTHFVPLPALMLLIFFVTYIGVTAVTAFAAKDLSGSATGGMLAATFAVVLVPFFLSNAASVVLLYVVPSFVVLPFALLALWRGVRGDPIWVGVAAGIATILHPVIGLEVGVLGLIAAASGYAVMQWPFAPVGKVFLGSGHLIAGFLILVLAASVQLVPYLVMEGTCALTTTEFIAIYAYFRNPHHLIPSTWAEREFVLATFFVAATVFTLVRWHRDHRDGGRHSAATGTAITAVLTLIIASAVGGYIFVEVFPSRLWTIAQAFRLMSFVAWFGWILVAGFVSMRLRIGDKWGAGIGIAGVLTAPAFLVAQLSHVVIDYCFPVKNGARRIGTVEAVILSMVVLWIVVRLAARVNPPTVGQILILLIGVTTAMMISGRHALLGLFTLSFMVILVLAILGIDRYANLPIVPAVSRYVAMKQPILTLGDVRKSASEADLVALAEVARRETEPQALFLTPKDWGLWRLIAERAIVADWKSYPFQDCAMKRWHQRVVNLYERGPRGYNALTPSEVLALQRTYGFQYAVLQNKADIPFPVLAKAGEWILVEVGGVHLDPLQEENSLMPYWTMNEGVGTLTADSSSIGNHGSLLKVNGVTWVDGRLGKAAQFDGVDGVIQVPYSADLDHGTGEFTWAAWVKLNATGVWQTIFSNYNSQDPYVALWVSNTNQLTANLRDASGATATAAGFTALSAGTWYHVAITRSGATVKLYLNSVQDGGTTTGPKGDTYHKTSKLNFGAHPTNGAQATFTSPLDGLLEEVRVYNRALTPEELQIYPP